MNYTNCDEKRLEELPSRKTRREILAGVNFDGAIRSEYDLNLLSRWIVAQKGRRIDDVIHDFVKLTWIPAKYRRPSTLRNVYFPGIQFDTLVEDGKVCYHSYMHCGTVRPVEGDEYLVYVHPITRRLEIYEPPPLRESRNEKYQREMDEKVRFLGDFEQLAKIDGVWYYARCAPVPEPPYVPYNGFWHRMSANCRRVPLFLDGKVKPFVKLLEKRQLSKKELLKYKLKNSQ